MGIIIGLLLITLIQIVSGNRINSRTIPVDNHGCVIGSGYNYCSYVDRCQPPGAICNFTLHPYDFDELEHIDSYGCMPNIGYSYCNYTNRCHFIAFTLCKEDLEGSDIIGGTDTHGCSTIDAYVFCESLNMCIIGYQYCPPVVPFNDNFKSMFKKIKNFFDK